MSENTTNTTKLIDDQSAPARLETAGNSTIKLVKDSGPSPTSADVRLAQQRVAEAVARARASEVNVAQPLPPVVEPSTAAILAKKELVLEQPQAPKKAPTKFKGVVPVLVLRKKHEVTKQGSAPREVKQPEALQLQDLQDLVQLNAQVEAGVIETPPGLSLEVQLFLELARRIDMFQLPNAPAPPAA